MGTRIHSEEESAFTRGTKERPLCVIVDLDRMNPSPEAEALLAIGRHELITLLTTSDASPPTITLDIEALRNESGWPVIIRDADDKPKTYWAVWSNSVFEFARRHAESTREPLAEIERRYLLTEAGNGRADALVLASPDGVQPPGLAERGNVVSLAAALALCGLFLRSRDEGAIDISDHSRHSMSLGTQYFLGARSLLPAGWKWFSACSRANPDVGVAGKGEAVLRRFPRCIRARDEILWRAFNPVRKSDQDGILFYADALLLMLGGCFDAAAAVADAAYLMQSRPENIGWRRARWRKSLQTKAPRLHELTEPGTRTRAVIDLVAAARNTIHGDPLRGVESESGSEARHLIDIPAQTATAIGNCASVLGGATTWAALDEVAHLRMLDPVPFFQVLVPLAAAALDAIMETTDVERLSGVDSDDLLTGPPTDGLFEPHMTMRVQLLLGLRAPTSTIAK